MTCERCGADGCEVHHSVTHEAWLCRRCHLHRPTLKRQVELVLSPRLQPRADIARVVGRDPKDGSVGRALKRLVNEGRAIRDGDGYREASP